MYGYCLHGKPCDKVVVIIFWDFLTFYQKFFLPQVKQGMIISNKNEIYKFPWELPDNLKLRILKLLVPSLSPKMKILSVSVKNY